MSTATEPPDTAPFTRQTAAALARGPFGRYAAGTAVSQTGTWMQSMAQSWVMTGLTTSAFSLGLVQAATSLPMLLLSMYGGTLADRHDKRLILVATQVVQITLAIVIGVLVASGHVQIWHIIVAATLLGISASFEMPADSALVPEIVEKENIAAAIAVDRAIFHGTRLIGPALAGYFVYRLGTASAFYANALSFVALIAALLSIKPRARGTEEEEQQRTSGMMAGVHFVRQDRPTMAMLGIMASSSLCIFPFLAVMMPLYSRDDLGLNAKYTGLLMSVSGIGSLVASIGMLRVPRSRRVAFMAVATVDIVLAMLGLAFARTFWQAVPALAMLAVGTSLNYGLAGTTLQERAPGPLRGRISALAMLSWAGVMPFSSLGITKIADLTSIRHTVMGCAVAYGVATFCLFAGPARRADELPAAQAAAVPVEV